MKVAFILLSSLHRPVPSTRVAVGNMLPKLKCLGFECEVLFAPERASESPCLPPTLYDDICRGQFHLVVFQKVGGADVLQLAARLRQAGIKTCFMVCDLVDADMVAATDGTIVVTEFLRELHPPELRPRIAVVHDGIERPEVARDQMQKSKGPLKAVLVTSAYLVHLPVIGVPPPWLQVTVVGPYRTRLIHRIQDFRWTLKRPMTASQRLAAFKFLLSPRIRCVPWHPQRVYDELLQADVGIIPIETTARESSQGGLPPDWMRKSENRLTLKMSAGLPVVATSIPSYEGVLSHATTGYFARSRSEWLDSLSRLRDPALRREMGSRARASVAQRFSMAEQARLLAAAFINIVSGSLTPIRSAVGDVSRSVISRTSQE